MIHKHKTVIASRRNKQNVRVFIPEKLRVNGVRYVQPYKFMRISASSQRMIVTLRDEITLFVIISRNEVVVSSPFSIELIKSYLDQIVSVIDKSTTGVFRVLRQPRDGYVPLPVEPNPGGVQPATPADPGDEAYYRGQAKIDFE